MDCVVPTNFRPARLACMLSTLLTQQLDEERRLYLIDNSGVDIRGEQAVRKTLTALQARGWDVHYRSSDARSVTGIKLEALRCGSDATLALIDNDIHFSRGDTLQALRNVLADYDVSVASPVAHDLDGDRPLCVHCEPSYDRYEPDANGVVESTTSFGTCMVLRRDDVEEVLREWRWRLPYLEDQVLGYFLKHRRGYACLRTHAILHWGESETPTYEFRFDEVIAHVRELLALDPRWQLFLELQLADRDAVDFPKKPERRCATS
jgi:hypothetical protein